MYIRHLFAKYHQYLRERFPFSQLGVLAIVMGLNIGALSLLLMNSSDFYLVVLPILGLYLFLLHLRIFDEFKDFEHDKKHYPLRPVPRGFISFVELKWLLGFVLFIEVMISLQSWLAFLLFGVTFFYSWLMYQEFFVRKWLRKHFTVYVLSHEILLLPLGLYLHSLILGNQIFLWSAILLIHSGFIMCNLFLLEVTRKIRAPEDELESQDTYSFHYGAYGVVMLVIALGMVLQGLTVFFSGSYWGVATLLLMLIPVCRYLSLSTRSHAKQIFLASIMHVLACLFITLTTWIS